MNEKRKKTNMQVFVETVAMAKQAEAILIGREKKLFTPVEVREIVFKEWIAANV